MLLLIRFAGVGFALVRVGAHATHLAHLAQLLQVLFGLLLDGPDVVHRQSMPQVHPAEHLAAAANERMNECTMVQLYLYVLVAICMHTDGNW